MNGIFVERSRVGWGWALVAGGGMLLAADPPDMPAAGDPPAVEWRRVDPVPARFSRVTDKAGCRWGLNRDGEIGLSNLADQRAGVFQRAGVLAVDGDDFKAQSAEVDDINHAVRLTGKQKDLEVTRNAWIDAERGGVRCLETIRNPTEASKPARVRVTTHFEERPAGYFDGEGHALTPDGKTQPAVVAILQPADDVRPGLVFLTGDSRGNHQPTVDRAEEGKRLVFSWELAVPARESVSVMYWILQRRALTAAQIGPQAQDFVRSGRPLRARLDKEVAGHVLNFPGAVHGDDSPVADALLGSLHKLCERLGVDRGDQDMYWMSAQSILSGEVQGSPLTVESRFGRITIPLEEVAAVQGGGGRGRLPRLYLRDGTVLTGSLTLPEWKVVGARGWTINLVPDAIEAVVMRHSARDGAGEPAPAVVAALNSGEVLPLQVPVGQSLAFASAWGSVETPVEQITAFHHLRQPSPGCRLWLADGSQLTVFPASRDLKAHSHRLGDLALNTAELAALWRIDKKVPDFSAEPEEIANLDDEDRSLCLLKGNNLVAGEIANESLVLVSGSVETVLRPADIRRIKRSESGNDLAPVFQFELTGGGRIDGVLRVASLSIQSAAGRWDVPAAHLVAMARAPDRPQ